MLSAQSPSSNHAHVVFPGSPVFQGQVSPAPPRAQRVSPIDDRDVSLSPDERAFLSWLFETSGIDVRRYKEETLKRRLPACLRAAHVKRLGEARDALQAQPRLRAAALSAVVIGVTSFFRDTPVFSALADRVLPELAQAGSVSVWSVGCSDGAELYSVAMLLSDRGLLGQGKMLGTDCRADAIARARTGCFDAALARDVPADLAARFLRRLAPFASERHVTARLLAACEWAVADAFADEQGPAKNPTRWDLILCRNLAIYLRPEAASLLYRRLATKLRPGGILVLGKAERPVGVASLQSVGPCLFRAAADRAVAVLT